MPTDLLTVDESLVVLLDLAAGPLRSVGSMPQDELQRNAGLLVEACSVLQLPVLVAKAPLPGEAGAPVADTTRLGKSCVEVTHETNDCFQSLAFRRAVESSGRKQLIFAGIALDVGVGLTALTAIRFGYRAAVLVDVCGAINARVEQVSWMRLSGAGALLLSWTTMIGELQGNYGKEPGPKLLSILRAGIQGGDGLSAG